MNVQDYLDGAVQLYSGDCIDIMPKLGLDGTVDSIVYDPPYGLNFMSRKWDKFSALAFQEFTEAWAREAIKLLKPGGHLLAFGSPRTYHRLACGLEDAGFEVRDTVMSIPQLSMPS